MSLARLAVSVAQVVSMTEGGYTSKNHVNWEVFMAIGIFPNYRCLQIIFILFCLASPSSKIDAADFGFSGMQIVGIDGRVAKALNLSKPEGVMVIDVVLGGPADIAKIKRGDLITHFDNIKIDTFNRLINIVTKTQPGQRVSVKVQRKGQSFQFSLKLGSKPESWNVNKKEVLSFARIGLTLASISPKIRKSFKIPWGTVGVLVTLIDPALTHRMKLRRGDVIVQVNQFDVWHPNQIKQHYDKAKAAGRPQLLILIERTDGFRYMMLPVK